MTTHNFCTLFDSGYLFKGVAMLNSLIHHCPGAHVYVLSMDEKTHEILNQLKLPFITCIKLNEIENEELILAKKDRTVAEYCWTLSPCLPWYVLQNYPEIDFITYIDADLFFYSSVEPVFNEIGNNSIAIIEHRFTPRLKYLEVNGKYCVEWVSFRRNEEGIACLSRWREQCIDWCYYRLEDGRLGDQKYLDEWPDRYPSCHIIQHSGAGIAPWNYAQYDFEKDVDNNITVNGAPLIFYHFHQFQLLKNGEFVRALPFYTSECPVPEEVYKTYEDYLKKIIVEIRVIYPGFSGGLANLKALDKVRRWMQCLIPNWAKVTIRVLLRK